MSLFQLPYLLSGCGSKEKRTVLCPHQESNNFPRTSENAVCATAAGPLINSGHVYDCIILKQACLTDVSYSSYLPAVYHFTTSKEH
jgi:hypothetical protein